MDHMNAEAEKNDNVVNPIDDQLIIPHENDRSFIRWRLITTVLLFTATICQASMRNNVSFAVVAMVNSSSSGTSQTECGNYTDTTTARVGEFDWDATTRGLIISSYYWGYIVPLLFVGFLVDKYGAKLVMIMGISVAVVSTLLGPIAARTNFGFFIMTRVMCGFGNAAVPPCSKGIIAKWYNTGERSKMVAISESGVEFGSAIATALCGYLCQYGSDGGWPWTFYVFGAIGALWLVPWYIFAYSSPRENPWISRREIIFIEANVPTSNHENKPLLPWRAMLTSAAVWGLAINHFGHGWSIHTLSSNLPSYMSEVLGFDIESNGLYSSLPDFLSVIYSYCVGFLADYLISKNVFSITRIRKTFGLSAFYSSALCLLIITFLMCQNMAIFAMLALATILDMGNRVGGSSNVVDVAPNFAGIMEGFSSVFGTIPGIVSPYISGVITEGKETKESWDIVFYISIGISVVCGTMYGLIGNAEIQPWNNSNNKNKTEIESPEDKADVLALP